MSQTPSGGAPLGTERIDFVGNTAPLQAAAGEAVNIAQGAGDKAAEAAAKGGKGFDQEIGGSFRRLRGAASAVAAAIAIADQALKSFASARDEVENLANAFGDINNATSALRSLGEGGDTIAKALRSSNDEFDRLLKEIKKAKEGEAFSLQGLFDITARTLAGADNPFEAQIEQIAQKRKEAAALADSLRATGEQDAIDAAAASDAAEHRKKQNADLLALQKEAVKVREAGLTEEERINNELDKQIDAIESLKERAESGGTLTPALLSATEKLEKAFRDAAKKGIEKGADEAMKSVTDSLNRALAQVQQQAASLFSPDKLGIQIQELGRIMEQVASNTRNLR